MVALIKELLVENPGYYILSGKFSQDPLEQHFSAQKDVVVTPTHLYCNMDTTNLDYTTSSQETCQALKEIQKYVTMIR